MAERTLVWSFNHIQIQCYAVMKIILKEFIKTKCSPQNYVLCSYFVKTFLFWKYETTDINFWCPENFRECIKVLLVEFSQRIREGMLRHYFIPTFNLFSIKFTPQAQAELLPLFEMAIQCDISILKDCFTLQDVWSTFLSATENRSTSDIIRNIERDHVLKNDKFLNKHLLAILCHSEKDIFEYITNFRTKVSKLCPVICKTPLKDILIKRYLQLVHIRELISRCPGNKKEYQLQKFSEKDAFSVDISTGKLWYAFFLMMKGDYNATLTIVNKVLSNITPFSLYFRATFRDSISLEAERLYKDKFLNWRENISERAKCSWLFDLKCYNNMTHIVPLAIQIELDSCDTAYNSSDLIKEYRPVVDLSPFVCAFYLMFLCYHELRQYDERDLALRQLVDATNNPMQWGTFPYNSYNITGHCLFMAGEITKAQEVFIKSYQSTLLHPPHDEFNSAAFYLRRLFNIEM